MKSTKTQRGLAVWKCACRMLCIAIPWISNVGVVKAVNDPGSGSESQPSKDAWNDPDNPTRKFWDGERLDLWSLRPVAPWNPPAITDKVWSKHPFDSYVIDGLKGTSLQPSPTADPRTLVRRVSIDLTGMPPTPDEVDAFVEQADDPIAYERCVDRLLAEPNHGIRWGQHWLDVARYADSNGFERDEWLVNRWRYRQYVIDALNEDLPYDIFLREQLTGDLLNQRDPEHPRSQERAIATLFLRLGPYDTYKEFFDSKELARDEYLADVTNTVGTAILGQTMDCCRCHDHKTDPLLHDDHYRLRAFFASLDFENELVIDSRAREQEIAQQHSALNHRLEPLQQHRNRLLEPGQRIQRQQVISMFPSSIVELLQVPEEKRTAIDRSKLQPLLDALEEITDEECLAHLSESNQRKVQELDIEIERLESEKWEYTTIPGVRDSERAPSVHVLLGGDIQSPLHAVTAGLPTLFSPDTVLSNTSPSTKPRDALANWVTDPSNPWTARVIANRLWFHYFGTGIVQTVDDLGYSGARPSHPELLDALAFELRRSDWSLKRLHRQIVLSATYQQSSYCSSDAARFDPFNRRIARQNQRRLDAESLRDSLLTISGLLRTSRIEEPRWPPIPEELLASQQGAVQRKSRSQGYHTSPDGLSDVRSVFLIRKRSLLHPFMTVFQLPDLNRACGRRDASITPSQALALLNNELPNRAAVALAADVMREVSTDVHRCVDRAYSRIVGRSPTPQEHEIMVAFVSDTTHSRVSLDEPSASLFARLTELCRAVFNSNTFLFID